MKFVIVHKCFSNPSYAAPVAWHWSDRRDEAHVYDTADGDNPQIKLAYFRGVATHQGLNSRSVKIDAV